MINAHRRTTRARAHDPQTSFDAGLAATTPSATLRASQARVLNMFKVYGDMHDKQLLAYLHDAETSIGLRPMSPSGARSRRSELAKPNMDRLETLVAEWKETRPETLFVADNGKAAWAFARETLRREGFRSPLWDTGKREIVDGRQVIVWGLAK